MTAEVIHGDCLEVMRTMEPQSVDAIVSDPPYLNTGTGAARVSTVRGIPDERQFFDLWMREVWTLSSRVLKPNGALWMTIDWRGAIACESAAVSSDLTFGAVGVWTKGGLGMGYMLRKTYECFVVARMPKWERTSQDTPDVWAEKWNPAHRTAGHEAEKPVALLVRAINFLGVPRGGVVLDPFCGSGSTGVAARQTGRAFVGIEREAEYVTIARDRMSAELNDADHFIDPLTVELTARWLADGAEHHDGDALQAALFCRAERVVRALAAALAAASHTPDGAA